MKKRKDGRYLKVVTINGKRLYFYSSKTTEQQAERDINRQILSYTKQEEKGKLFCDVAEEWEEEHFPKIEYNTARRYKVLLNYAIEEFEDIYIKDIQPIDVEQYLNYFVSRNYSSKSIKDTLSVLRLVCKYACIKGYITTDPTRYITPPKGKAPVKRQALTEEEVEIVKDNINQPFGLFPYFLMYTGLRKGEALALQYKDIDFDNKEISVSKSIYYKGGVAHIKGTKTESGERKVFLPDVLADKLSKGKAEEYLFSVDGTKPLAYSTFERKWKKYKEEVGLNITAHQLRHTYATILFEAEIDAKDAQYLLGHSDISVTRNIYTHIRKNHLEQTGEKLNRYIS